MPTVVELKKLAKSRGFKGYSKMRKAELLKLLEPPSFIETIGTDCLDIIFDYKNGMETAEKMKRCLAEIQEISHSYIFYPRYRVTICARITNAKAYYYYYQNGNLTSYMVQNVWRET